MLSLERYTDTLFTVLRPARYLDAEEEVEFGELHVITGSDFLVAIRHAERPDLGLVRRRREAHPELLRQGPDAILSSFIDRMVERVLPGRLRPGDRHRRDRASALQR